MTDSPTSRELDDVVAALAAADRVLIASHENPDGDAIGSMSAAALALRAAGKQVRLYLHSDSPLPHEYRSEEHTSELQSQFQLVCRLLLEKKNPKTRAYA